VKVSDFPFCWEREYPHGRGCDAAAAFKIKLPPDLAAYPSIASVNH
jgi:hypothetical protein